MTTIPTTRTQRAFVRARNAWRALIGWLCGDISLTSK